MPDFRWTVPSPEASPAPDPGTMLRLAAIPVANLGDAMDSFGVMAPRIRHLGGPTQLCGIAFTVETHPSDNLALHRALAVPEAAGRVLVVAAGEGSACALFGELMLTEAVRRGILGLVLDGYVRDIEVLQESEIPIFAVGVHPRRATKTSEGRLGWPVACGGVAVSTGDAVLGDEEGVAVIPSAMLSKVLHAAEAVRDKETGIRAKLKDHALGDILGLTVRKPEP